MLKLTLILQNAMKMGLVLKRTIKMPKNITKKAAKKVI
jgi:hypothetical protein